MKKISAILAAAVAGVSIAGAEELSISTTFAWESEYIFRGVQLADEYFAPAVDFSYGDFYAGIWSALPVEGEDANEVDFYAGMGVGINEMVSADFGFTYYTYPSSSDEFFDGDVNTFEIYTGASFETTLSPAVYVFYDFDLEAFTLEGSIGHSVEAGTDGSIDLSAYLGYVSPDEGDEYTYYGASVGYSYAFTENAAWSIGVNWYGSEDPLGFNEDGSPQEDSKFSISTSITAGF